MFLPFCIEYVCGLGRNTVQIWYIISAFSEDLGRITMGKVHSALYFQHGVIIHMICSSTPYKQGFTSSERCSSRRRKLWILDVSMDEASDKPRAGFVRHPCFVRCAFPCKRGTMTLGPNRSWQSTVPGKSIRKAPGSSRTYVVSASVLSRRFGCCSSAPSFCPFCGGPRKELETLDMSPAIYGGIGGGAGGSGGLGSPVVQGILDRWIDVGKRRILEGWLAHVLHGGSVDSANGCFVPRVQISSLSKEARIFGFGALALELRNLSHLG